MHWIERILEETMTLSQATVVLKNISWINTSSPSCFLKYQGNSKPQWVKIIKILSQDIGPTENLNLYIEAYLSVFNHFCIKSLS